jgi:hypothetical protein
VKAVEPLERELCAAYEQEAEIYTRALSLAEQVPAALHKGEDGDALVSQIAGLLAQIGQVEHRLAGSKERWRTEGAHPGPELRCQLARVATLIKQMQEHLDLALCDAEQQKDNLAPELDDMARRRQGFKAYGAMRRSS